MSLIRTLSASLVLCSSLALGACAADDGPRTGAEAGTTGGTTDGATDGATGGDDGTTGETGNDRDPAVPVSCAATQPLGAIQTDGGWITYQNQPMVATAAHDAGSGCLSNITLDFEVQGGCKLTLEFEGAQGAWVLVDGKLQGDSACGEFWEGGPVNFDLDASESVGSLIGVPTVDAGTDAACAEVPDAQIIGKALFVSPGDDERSKSYFNVNLNSLGFKGALPTAGSGAVEACPVDARTCQGVICGQDYFGADCGVCTEQDTTCAGGECVPSGCIGVGDGRDIGFHIANQTFSVADGTSFDLHEGCGSGAVWMVRTAGWCYYCSAFAPRFQEIYEQYKDRGVTFVLVVGQDGQGYPATAAYSKDYAISHGYQDGWVIVNDPNWITMGEVMSAPGGTPTHAVLDQNRILRYNNATSQYVQAPVDILENILKEQGL